MERLFDRMTCIFAVCITVVVLSIPVLAQESSPDSSWNNAQAEMKAMFGQVPVEFKHMPDYMRGITWK